jgi:hypothetical protein
VVGVEELDVVERTAIELLDDLLGGRSLDLEPVLLAHNRLAHRRRGGALVPFDLDVVVTGLGVEVKPVRHRRPADELIDVLLQVEEDAIADHVAVVVAGHELLCLAGGEVLERVDAGIRQQLQRIRTFDEDVRHVPGLVVEHAGLTPRPLLVAPVGELRGLDRVDVGADRVVP